MRIEIPIKAEVEIADCARCGEDAVIIEIDGQYFARPRRFSKCKGYKFYRPNRGDICRTELQPTPEEAAEEWRQTTDAEQPDRAHPWRPIETAPRDGTLILLYPTNGDGLISTGYRRPNDDHWSAGGGWFNDGEVSHWTPIPEAPGGETRDARPDRGAADAEHS